ncbi:hypothetical protein NQD34_006769 [Periophthalmus magnuspinnatus]|nr:hypothetical protein NQD34_006769 [Periophthalmus magnuspinnatus]
MMVKQQQRRTDRCFLPVGSNNVTLVQFPAQRRPRPSIHEVHQPPQFLFQEPVRETQGEDGESEAKRIFISDSEETLTNRETGPESCNQSGSDACSLEDRVSPEDGVQQVMLESSEDNRAAELASAGCLKVTIQRSSESREFGEKDHTSDRFTCHLCHCSCPSAQSFQHHMSGVDHQHRLQQITQSIARSQTGAVSSRWQHRASVRWCDVCQSHFTGDVILHRRSKQHKEYKKSSRPFCPVCHRHFRTPRKFVEHMKSPEHKQQVHLDKSQEDDMITVDAVGCFESESKIQFGDKEGGDQDRREKEERDEEREDRVGAEKDIGDKDRESEKGGKDTKQSGKEGSRSEEETRREKASKGDKDAQLGERVGTIDQRRNKEMGGKYMGGKDIGGKKGGDIEEGLDVDEPMDKHVNQTAEDTERDAPQELNPHTVYDSSYVVPVSGFFCRLCHKFFFRETARNQHCSTLQHLTRVLQTQRGPQQTQESAEPS